MNITRTTFFSYFTGLEAENDIGGKSERQYFEIIVDEDKKFHFNYVCILSRRFQLFVG